MPVSLRMTFHSMVRATNIPKNTLHDLMKNEAMLWRHSLSLQPHRTEQHKVACLASALDKVIQLQDLRGNFVSKTCMIGLMWMKSSFS